MQIWPRVVEFGLRACGHSNIIHLYRIYSPQEQYVTKYLTGGPVGPVILIASPVAVWNCTLPCSPVCRTRSPGLAIIILPFSVLIIGLQIEGVSISIISV